MYRNKECSRYNIEDVEWDVESQDVHSESCIRLRIGGLTRESGARTRTGVLSGTGTDRSDVLQSESARSETNATLMKSYFFYCGKVFVLMGYGKTLAAFTMHLQRNNGSTWFLWGNFHIVGSRIKGFRSDTNHQMWFIVYINTHMKASHFKRSLKIFTVFYRKNQPYHPTRNTIIVPLLTHFRSSKFTFINQWKYSIEDFVTKVIVLNWSQRIKHWLIFLPGRDFV